MPTNTEDAEEKEGPSTPQEQESANNNADDAAANKDDQSKPEDTTATLKFKISGATLTYNNDGGDKKNVTADTDDKSAKVNSTVDFKFTVTPDDGQQLASVKSVTADGTETDLKANENGEYTLPAENVTDGTTIEVTAEAVPEPETPAEEETTETDTTVTDDTTVEDEETTPETTLNSVQSVDNGISLMAAFGGSGTENDPYLIEPGDSAGLPETNYQKYRNWQIKKSTSYNWMSWNSRNETGSVTVDDATLSGDNGSAGDWFGYGARDATATISIASNAEPGQVYQVRYGNNGGGTYFKVANRVSATSIDVSIDHDSIMVGETAQATATVEPSNAGYTWRSNNTNVATVDSNGRVTAKGIGTATISATTSNGLFDSVRVTVTRNTNNDVVQTTHFYVAYPGVEDPDAGTWNPGNWLYAGEGKASLPPAAETTGGTIITGDLDSLVTDAPIYYMNKTITVDGVTYKWDKDGTRQPGTFTVVWDRENAPTAGTTATCGTTKTRWMSPICPEQTSGTSTATSYSILSTG